MQTCLNCGCTSTSKLRCLVCFTSVALEDTEKRKRELWYKHMRNEPMTEDEIEEYGKLTGFL